MTRKTGRLLGISSVTAVGAVMLFSACPPPYPKCESDEHCKEHGEVCVQGQCVECATDANCKEGMVCDTNRCVPKPECVDDSKCGPGRKCSAGKCIADVSVECTGDTDCPSGQQCKAGKCIHGEASACTFDPVRFGFDEYSLTSSAQTALSKYADCIKRSGLRFTLEGFADERGTEEYNMVLSQKRAASVRKYLVDLGVGGSALDTIGFGENRPAVVGSNEEAWAANRRVEFKKR